MLVQSLYSHPYLFRKYEKSGPRGVWVQTKLNKIHLHGLVYVLTLFVLHLVQQSEIKFLLTA